MALRKKAAPAGLRVWTVAELGAFYSSHRSELVAHAMRILKDTARAEEVVHESLLKVLLAAPELETQEHALGYLHRTIENLCIDIFRAEGRRPSLILLDDAKATLEASWIDSGDHAEAIAAAEDAAIVRQALSLLSPAERAALVMWEMEGRSTAEIAAELGIKESSVRHTVSRARTSFRRILAEFVIDEDRGLTALDLLSSSYRKASSAAKKSSKIALSLVLVFFAFLGFNNLTSPTVSPLPVTSNGNLAVTKQSIVPVNQSKSDSKVLKPASAPMKVSKVSISGANAKATDLSFAGLDKTGVPKGFTVADSSGGFGPAYISQRAPVASDSELTSSQIIKTTSGAANILITQALVTDSSGFTYIPNISFSQGGNWIPLVSRVTSTETTRLLSGNYLVSIVVTVDSAIESPIRVPASANGRDLVSAPRQVVTRIVLDGAKTQVLAQAIYVVERGAK